MGTPLTSKEVSRSMDHRPKDAKTGKFLCWDHFSHRKCTRGAKCPHSHSGPAPKWDSLDWSVQLQLLRRGGHPARPRLKPHQVDAQVESIRRDQTAKQAANVAEGRRQKAGREPTPARAEEVRQDTRAGWLAPPEELAGFHPTDMEEPLRELFKGTVDSSWTADHAPPAARTALLDAAAGGAEATRREERMQAVESSQALPAADGLLGTYLRNRILNLEGRDATPGDVQDFLEQALVEGSPELASAATAFLEQHPGDRVGSATSRGKLSPLTWASGLGSGTFSWALGDWDVRDFGDQKPRLHAGASAGRRAPAQHRASPMPVLACRRRAPLS